MSVGSRDGSASVSGIVLKCDRGTKSEMFASSPTTQVKKVDEIGNVVNLEADYSPEFTLAHISFHHAAVRFDERSGIATSTSMKRELLTSDVSAGPVNERSRVVSLPPTARQLMVDMKIEDGGAASASESSV